jgi:hypothetical protein
MANFSLIQIASASSILYDFGERLGEQCRQEQGPNGETFACLPSPFEIHMMMRNVAAMRGRLGEIKAVVVNATEEAGASSSSAVAGVSSSRGRGGDSGAGGEELNVLCVPSVARSTTSGAIRKRKKRGSKAKVCCSSLVLYTKHFRGHHVFGRCADCVILQKSFPAPNPAGKCYNCGSVESTEWRRGPDGLRTLCNPCGICYSKAPLPSEHDVGGWSPAGVVGSSTEKLA